MSTTIEWLLRSAEIRGGDRELSRRFKETADKIDRLEKAVDAAAYYIDRLEARAARRAVRDMTKAMEGWDNAFQKLGEPT